MFFSSMVENKVSTVDCYGEVSLGIQLRLGGAPSWSPWLRNAALYRLPYHPVAYPGFRQGAKVFPSSSLSPTFLPFPTHIPYLLLRSPFPHRGFEGRAPLDEVRGPRENFFEILSCSFNWCVLSTSPRLSTYHFRERRSRCHDASIMVSFFSAPKGAAWLVGSLNMPLT